MSPKRDEAGQTPGPELRHHDMHMVSQPPPTALPPTAMQKWTRTVLRFRCPYCGQGRIFERGLHVRPVCAVCGETLDRDPGNFLGALIVSHLLTFAVVVVAGIYWFRTGQTDGVEWRLVALAAIVTVATYPPVRAIWLLTMLRLPQETARS